MAGSADGVNNMLTKKGDIYKIIAVCNDELDFCYLFQGNKITEI
jgi:hypothetical protein